MASLNQGLNTARSGLMAAQTALDVTSHNIANSATDGYSRQTVQLVNVSPYAGGYTYQTTDAYVGNGVDSSNVTQARDTFLDGRYRDANALYSDYNERNDLLSQVEDIFNEVPSGDSDDLVGLSGSLSSLVTSLSTYQEQPNDTVTDQDVQSAVSDVVLKIKNDYNNLDSFETSEANALQTVVTGSSDGSVTTGGINGILTKITNLNTQIAAQELGGQSANDLRDQRNNLLDELSGYMDITSVEQSDGKVTVKVTGDTSGAMLIDQGNHAHTLTVTSDSTQTDSNGNAYTTYGITWDPNGTYNKGNSTYTDTATGTGNDVTVSGGSVNGYLSVLNGNGEGTSSTNQYGDVGVVYLKERLNDFAKAFADSMNGVVTSYYTSANASTSTDVTVPTDLLLNYTAGSAASTISLSSSWTGDSNASYFSTLFTNTQANGGNSSAGLSDYAQSFYNELNGTTLSSTYSSYYTSGTLQEYADTFSNSIATVKSNASDYADYYNTTTTNIDTQRQSVSSVSIDEESINLIKYQQAYGASARVVTTINDMMETLLAMGQ